MPSTVDTTLSDVYTDVGNFVVATLGLSAGQMVQGYANRVAMPVAGGFVVMTATANKRLRTNVDSWDQTIPDPTTATQELGMQLSLQLDCYGPSSAEWAVILTDVFRDEIGCNALTVCQPLYSDDPIRAPLTDAELQYEDKWIVRAQVQYNPVVTGTQQFVNALAINLIEVDEAYPP
jgi:hypothetical protein